MEKGLNDINTILTDKLYKYKINNIEQLYNPTIQAEEQKIKTCQEFLSQLDTNDTFLRSTIDKLQNKQINQLEAYASSRNKADAQADQLKNGTTVENFSNQSKVKDAYINNIRTSMENALGSLQSEMQISLLQGNYNNKQANDKIKALRTLIKDTKAPYQKLIDDNQTNERVKEIYQPIVDQLSQFENCENPSECISLTQLETTNTDYSTKAKQMTDYAQAHYTLDSAIQQTTIKSADLSAIDNSSFK